MGLYENITSGLNLIFKKKKTAIILEDDILVSKHFLRYMNDSLKFYKNNIKVGSICGNLPFLNKNLPNTFFFILSRLLGLGNLEKIVEIIFS